MIKNIQFLRALAAFMVAYYHLGYLTSNSNLPTIGANGVDLFFVISGFVMILTTRQKNLSPLHFMGNRISRVAPFYWLMTFAIFFVAIFTPSLLKATHPDVIELIKSLLFIPFIKSDGLMQPLLFVGWTLNYEMFFYFLFSIGLCARNYILGFLGVIISIVSLVAWGALMRPSSPLLAFYTNPIILEFAFGMALALVWEHLPTKVGLPLKLFALASTAIALPIAFFGPTLWPDYSRTISSGIPSAIAVISIVTLDKWGWSINNSFLLLLGDSSYSLYISHAYLIFPMEKLIRRFPPSPFLALAALVTLLALSVWIAIILHRFLERPLSQLARRLLLRTSETPSITRLPHEPGAMA